MLRRLAHYLDRLFVWSLIIGFIAVGLYLLAGALALPINFVQALVAH